MNGSTNVESAERGNLRLLTRSLRSRNFRLYVAGQSISLTGTWLQRIATLWLAYRLTHSAFLLGVVGFAGQIPTFVLSPFGGVLADRWNRHRTLLITQVLALAQAAVLAALVLTGGIDIWHLIALSVVLGTINALDIPVRQAFIVRMIDRKADLHNAIALNSSMVNAARMIGPSLAGILIAAIGEGGCFLVNALSYVPVIAALLAMRIPPEREKPTNGRVLEGIAEGIRYIRGFAPIRYLILLVGLVSLAGMPYLVLMPVFAADYLGGGAHTLGFLMGAAGLGALVGTVYLASRRTVRDFARLSGAAAGVFGAGLIAFALVHDFWIDLLMLFVAGLGMMVQVAGSNTLIQTVVDDDKRGRVMSFFSMAFMGMAPFGSLFAGSLASRIGSPVTIALGGAVCIIGAAAFSRKLPGMHEILHPIYRKMGILPELPQ